MVTKKLLRYQWMTQITFIADYFWIDVDCRKEKMIDILYNFFKENNISKKILKDENLLI